MEYQGKATSLHKRPQCNFCENPAVADGATIAGSWGYMCNEHFSEIGSGLGLGKGQVLLCGDEFDARIKSEYLIT